MKQGFSPVGLLISKTINTFSCIRRGLRLNWPSSSHLPRTTQALKKTSIGQRCYFITHPRHIPIPQGCSQIYQRPTFQYTHESTVNHRHFSSNRHCNTQTPTKPTWLHTALS
jgi:hypothetical protein